MAGAKGRSGGARANAGGARAGSGRKPKAAAKSANADSAAAKKSKSEPVPIPDTDMLTLLQDVALGRVDATNIQVRAAIAAVQYTHTKKGDGGKKEEQADKAKKAAGKFGALAPPLKLVNRK